MMFKIRLIEEKDNLEIEKIIRDCLIEYGANHEGTAWADEYLCRLSFVYSEPKTAYYVAVDENENIVGGCGIGKLEEVENTCELQKMFCSKSVRETVVVKLLLDACLSFAKKYYNSVYLEIPQNFDREITFFENNHHFKFVSYWWLSSCGVLRNFCVIVALYVICVLHRAGKPKDANWFDGCINCSFGAFVCACHHLGG